MPYLVSFRNALVFMKARKAWWVAVSAATSLFAACSAGAATWHAGAPQTTVLRIGSSIVSCAIGWGDPEGVTRPDGNLKMITQGGNPSQVCSPVGTPGKDSFFVADFVGGFVSFPPLNSCPPVRGFYMTSGSPLSCVPPNDYGPTNPGPIASSSVVKVGNRYFMAFVGGNADYIKGHIFWAVSTDAVNWTFLPALPATTPGYTWQPILRPEYGDPCARYGIRQLSLTYDSSTAYGPNGAFYIHFLYKHPVSGLDVEAYRFPYKPSDSYGLPTELYNGTPFGQLCISASSSSTATCSWTTHSGRLVWDYDSQPVVGSDPLLLKLRGMRQMAFGAGDVKYDPVRGVWLHIYTFSGQTSWQTATSLSSTVWTTPQPIDLSAFDAAMATSYPNYQAAERYNGGLWYGTATLSAGTRTGMWLLQPVDTIPCPGAFQGLGIVVAPLNYF